MTPVDTGDGELGRGRRTEVVRTPHSSNFSNEGVGALGVSMNSNSDSEPLVLCGFDMLPTDAPRGVCSRGSPAKAGRVWKRRGIRVNKGERREKSTRPARLDNNSLDRCLRRWATNPSDQICQREREKVGEGARSLAWSAQCFAHAAMHEEGPGPRPGEAQGRPWRGELNWGH